MTGLAEGGEDLPDEDIFSEEEIRFAPGALEGSFVRYTESHDDEAAIERLHRALVELADRPSPRARRRIRELFREGDVRFRVDALRHRLNAFLPRHAERLYSEMRTIFLESGHRDEVKYAIAIMSGFGRSDDADLFRLIGRHEEFTLYAAVALADVVHDPVREWLGLLEHVSGWGRTELSELILQQPQSAVIREKLLRQGLGIGNALSLATGCRLHEVLARPEVDDELLARAREIIDSLVWSWDSPNDLTDYEHAGEAVEAFVGLLRDRGRTLDEFLTVYEVRCFLSSEELRRDDETGEDRFERCGFDQERMARVTSMCDGFLNDDRWTADAQAALRSEDQDARRAGIEVAKRLGFDLHDYLVECLKKDPGDSGLWYDFVAGGDEAVVREVVDLATSLWDLDEIARGPALEHFGGPSGPLASVDFILQELSRYPGVGAPLIAASLRSPVIRHRLIALRALSRWDHTPSELIEQVRRLSSDDPDDDVRESAASVLAGEVISDPAAED